MKDKKKLKELLDRLDTLEGKSSFPEVGAMTQKFIQGEMEKAQVQIRQMPVVKVLEKIDGELQVFRKGFNVKEISTLVNNANKELLSSQGELRGELNKEIQNIRGELKKVLQDKSADDKIEALSKKLDSAESYFKTETEKNLTRIKDFQSALEASRVADEKSDTRAQGLEEKLETSHRDILSRLSRIGGGNANRQILMSSSVLSNKYTDLNLLGGTNTSLAKSDDDTNKRANLTINVSIPVAGTVTAISDGAGAVIDASLGNIFTWSAAADRTAGTTINPTAGQKMVIEFTASGGARTLTLPTATTGDFRFGSDITTLSQTASGKTDYIGCIYNGAASRWDVVAFTKGF